MLSIQTLIYTHNNKQKHIEMKYIAEIFYSLAYLFTLPPYLLSSIGNWFMAYNDDEEEIDNEQT